MPEWLLLLGACSLPTDTATPPTEPPSTIADLWDGAAADGDEVVLDRVLVTSPRTADDERFYVQDPDGGPRAGLTVHPRGALPTWPPPVGTPVRLRGAWHASDFGPTLDLVALADGEILGDPEGLSPVDATGDPELAGALVKVSATVTSLADPLGRADLDAEVDLGGAFAVPPPGWLDTGVLTGILTEPGRLSPRVASDWTGSMEGAPPQAATVAQIRAGAFADGTPVVLSEVVQAVGWSRGGRYTLVQDGEGTGLWVDAEGWGIEGSSGLSDVGTWTGEVRTDGEGLRLRTWTPVTVTGRGVAEIQTSLSDGALSTLAFSGVTGPDLLGDWDTAEEVILGDRFVLLEDLPATVTVTGPVRVAETGEVTLFPTGDSSAR
jgi:hypothetical protein